MLLYFANPKPTRKKLQYDREGTIGNSLGNQAVKTIPTRKEIHNTDRSPSFEMVQRLQRNGSKTAKGRRPFQNVPPPPPINKVVEPDLFGIIEEINN